MNQKKGTKRERLDKATKRAFAKNPKGGWRAARREGMTWCLAMWPTEFMVDA